MSNYHAGTPEPELVYAYKGEIEKLHAEIERLRVALDLIARPGGCETLNGAQHVARLVLEQK